MLRKQLMFIVRGAPGKFLLIICYWCWLNLLLVHLHHILIYNLMVVKQVISLFLCPVQSLKWFFLVMFIMGIRRLFLAVESLPEITI